jgi:hypothetical protein
MVKITTTTPPADILRDSKGIMRQSELLEELNHDPRQELDELAIEGKVKRFPVGDHIMLRWID